MPAHRSFSLRCAGCDVVWLVRTQVLHVVETTDDRTELWWPCGSCGWNTRGIRNFATREARGDEVMDDVEDRTVARYIQAGANWHDLSDLDASLVGYLETHPPEDPA